MRAEAQRRAPNDHDTLCCVRQRVPFTRAWCRKTLLLANMFRQCLSYQTDSVCMVLKRIHAKNEAPKILLDQLFCEMALLDQGFVISVPLRRVQLIISS